MPQKKKRSTIRQCKLTPEGWVYIVIVCFISIGAVLRNVNLLILSTGMLVAPLIFNWRVCMANLRSLKARRVVPERIHAQTSVNIAWTCDNDGGRLTARNVLLNDRVHEGDSSPKAGFVRRLFQSFTRESESGLNGSSASAEFAHVSFSGITKFDPGIASYQCYFPGRGKYDFGPAELNTSFPFGLVSCKIPLHEKESIFVAPPLGKLHPTWEKRIDSRDVGDQSRTRRRGYENDEFYALRKWRSGDSQKHIHWRSSAKFGYPMVKEFDQPNDRDFAMLLDLHSNDEVTRLYCEIILSFATTALSQLSSDVNGQLGLAICGEENLLVSGRQSYETHQNAMRRLAVAKPTINPSLKTSAIDLASRISSGTPVYCFSTRSEPDWLRNGATEEESLSPALNAVKHQLRWIHVESKEFKELFSIEFGVPESRSEESNV
jgi:uncharacterized protein (DUF58 family)